jgi:hypothetical protein
MVEVLLKIFSKKVLDKPYGLCILTTSVSERRLSCQALVRTFGPQAFALRGKPSTPPSWGVFFGGMKRFKQRRKGEERL